MSHEIDVNGLTTDRWLDGRPENMKPSPTVVGGGTETFLVHYLQEE